MVRDSASTRLRQSSSRAEGFSLQITRMKKVSTRRHRKVSSLQQLNSSIQTVLRSAHACSLNRVAVTSVSTDARNPAELNSTRLFSCRKSDFCRRYHQTASNSITSFIRRRRSRKHARGNVRHLFDGSWRSGGSSKQALSCSRPCRDNDDDLKSRVKQLLRW